MKIAMIGQKGIPSRTGGVEIHVEELARRLAARGHEVTVYCRKSYTEGAEPFHEGIRLRYMPTINTKHLDAITYTFLATVDALLAGQELFHYHALGPSSLSFIPKICGKKVVATVHGLDWKNSKWGRGASLFLKLGELVVTRIPNEVIVVSRNLQSYFEENHHLKTHAIANGVLLPEPSPLELIKEQYGLDSGEFLLFLGRLVPEKGIHYLLDAYLKLDTGKKLVIAGGSSYTDDYVARLKTMAGDDSRIIFTGFVGGRLLEELYTHACLYILPSENEGLPIGLLEAMSYSRCCLVSDIPGNLEVLDNHGYTFASQDAADLKSKLEMLLASPEKVSEIGLQAREHVALHYNWDRIVDETEELYRSLS